jgi:DNA-binding transcriptional ArsR family regulator
VYRDTTIYISPYRDMPLHLASTAAMPLDHAPMNLDDVIKALSHPVRRDILRWLKNPEGEFPDQCHRNGYGVCAGQIDQRCGLSQSTVSAHLATLQRAGLVTSRKVGQWHYFQRNEAQLQLFLEHLSAQL